MTRRNFDEVIAEFVSLSKEHVAAFLARKWKREEGNIYEEGDKKPSSIPASMVFHNFDVFKLQNALVLPREDDDSPAARKQLKERQAYVHLQHLLSL